MPLIKSISMLLVGKKCILVLEQTMDNWQVQECLKMSLLVIIPKANEEESTLQLGIGAFLKSPHSSTKPTRAVASV